MEDKPSMGKFGGSFFQIVPWLKTIRHLFGICIILLIMFGVYRMLFVKKNTQTTTFEGDVKEVNIIQNRKRVFIPFIEVSVSQESDRKMTTGIRGGLRFEF